MYMHHQVNAASLPDAYHQALLLLYSFGEKRPCPAYNTQEKSISITIDIARPLAEPRISKFIPCGPAELQQYVMEMKDGILDFEANVTGKWAYTYHDRMMNQLIEAVKILKRDRDSRRAVVMIRNRNDILTDDPPCLTMIQYFINDNALDCFVTFRSNDAVKAFFMNAFALIEIQKVLANILNCKVGHYVHTANSFHAYERDWDDLNRFCLNYIQMQKAPDRDIRKKDLVYFYDKNGIDDWYTLMQDEIPEIMDKVEYQMDKADITDPGRFVGNLRSVILRELGELK